MTGDSKEKDQKKTGRRVISLEESKDPEHLRRLGFGTEFIKIVQGIDPEEAERRQTQEKINNGNIGRGNVKRVKAARENLLAWIEKTYG